MAGPSSPAGTGKLRLTAGDAALGNTVNAATTTVGYSELNLRNNSTGSTTFGNDIEVVGTGLAIVNPLGSAPAGTTITMGNLKMGGGQELGVHLGAEPNHPIIFTSATLTGGDAKLSPKIPGFAATTVPGSDLVLGNISETAASSITMAGQRTLYLQGNSNYSGTTTISSGTLQVGGIAVGGTAGGALGGGAVTNNAALNFNRDTSSVYTANNAISGTGTVANLGTGTVVLGGANSYQGTTTVTAGTLLVNGTHTGGGAYTVASGATLGGTGTIAPAAAANVTVTGNLAPGASAGTLTVNLASGTDVLDLSPATA